MGEAEYLFFFREMQLINILFAGLILFKTL